MRDSRTQENSLGEILILDLALAVFALDEVFEIVKQWFLNPSRARVGEEGFDLP